MKRLSITVVIIEICMHSFLFQYIRSLYFFANSTSSNCFHKMLNRIPCRPFARIFVSRPRKKSPHTPLSQDMSNDLRIRQLVRMRLLVHFAHTNTVAACIADSTRAKPQNGSPTKFCQLRVLFWNLFRQEIVRIEPAYLQQQNANQKSVTLPFLLINQATTLLHLPWIVSNKGGRGSCQSTIVEGERSVDFDLVHHRAEFARDLHGRFDSVDWHEKDTKARCRHTSRHSLECHIEVFGRLVRIHKGQHACIGSRVSKARKWTLNQRR